MANSSINLTNLDPASYKAQLITFCKSQSVFKDYNFEDSNLNFMLDILSHNTFLNSYYKNMIYAESQLDSAELRSSAVSCSKPLNYIPLSRQSSAASVSLTINASNITIMELPKGTQFSGRNGINNFVYVTDTALVAKSSSNTFTFSNVMIYEGYYTSDTYLVDYTANNQKFIVSDPNVDISSLQVNVIENNGSSNTEFSEALSLYNLTPYSNVYFIEGYANSQYRVVFGNNDTGRYPLNNSLVVLSYRVSTGANTADGISSFNLDQDIAALNGGVLNGVTITTNQYSAGGSERETIDSIKFMAPRHFATQERAVNNTDYKTIVMNQFGSSISSVNVYGGEEVTPKQYGKTIIAIKPRNSDTVPNYLAGQVYSYLKDFTISKIVITNADNLLIKLNTTILYDSSETSYLPSDIETLVQTQIENYSVNTLGDFGKSLRYSKLGTVIDNTEGSIDSNSTDLLMLKRLWVNTGAYSTYTLSLYNPIKVESNSTVLSTNFDFKDSNNNIWLSSYLADDSNGNLNVKYLSNTGTVLTVGANVGSVDYQNGVIKISNLYVNNIVGSLDITAKPLNKDINATFNQIISIESQDIFINVTDIQTANG